VSHRQSSWQNTLRNLSSERTGREQLVSRSPSKKHQALPLLQQETVEKRFRVAEIFGPTIQGEGALIGRQTHFIRFGGCDYRCSWCDSMYAVDENEVAKLPRLSIDEIMVGVQTLPGNPEWVTLSGGNPALFDLLDLVNLLQDNDYMVGVETQGTVFKDWLQRVDLVTVSPKPPSSGNVTTLDVLDPFLWKLGGRNTRTAIKIVVFNDEDYEYARNIFAYFPPDPYERWVQVGNPVVTGQSQTQELLDRLRWLSEKIVKDDEMWGVCVTPQLHTLIWGNQRAH
jgi:7-carboxy-7-deazaguanine synthase